MNAMQPLLPGGWHHRLCTATIPTRHLKLTVAWGTSHIDSIMVMQAKLAKERAQTTELTQHLRQAKQALVRRGQLVEELRSRVSPVRFLGCRYQV